MSAKRCLCASVTAARLYGRSSSVPKPGIHIFQLRSRYSCTSFTSTFDTLRCFANKQAAFTVFSTKSSAICNNNSSTSSSNCSLGSISLTYRRWSHESILLRWNRWLFLRWIHESIQGWILGWIHEYYIKINIDLVIGSQFYIPILVNVVLSIEMVAINE